MNNENLTHTLTREEQRKGGIRSGEVRRERKKLREELDILLSRKDLQKDICQALIEKALSGEIRAFEVLRDTLGETMKTFNISSDPDNNSNVCEIVVSRNKDIEEKLLEEKHIRNIELSEENKELEEKVKLLEEKVKQLEREESQHKNNKKSGYYKGYVV